MPLRVFLCLNDMTFFVLSTLCVISSLLAVGSTLPVFPVSSPGAVKIKCLDTLASFDSCFSSYVDLCDSHKTALQIVLTGKSGIAVSCTAFRSQIVMDESDLIDRILTNLELSNATVFDDCHADFSCPPADVCNSYPLYLMIAAEEGFTNAPGVPEYEQSCLHPPHGKHVLSSSGVPVADEFMAKCLKHRQEGGHYSMILSSCFTKFGNLLKNSPDLNLVDRCMSEFPTFKWSAAPASVRRCKAMLVELDRVHASSSSTLHSNAEATDHGEYYSSEHKERVRQERLKALHPKMLLEKLLNYLREKLAPAFSYFIDAADVAIHKAPAVLGGRKCTKFSEFAAVSSLSWLYCAKEFDDVGLWGVYYVPDAEYCGPDGVPLGAGGKSLGFEAYRSVHYLVGSAPSMGCQWPLSEEKRMILIYGNWKSAMAYVPVVEGHMRIAGNSLMISSQATNQVMAVLSASHVFKQKPGVITHPKLGDAKLSRPLYYEVGDSAILFDPLTFTVKEATSLMDYLTMEGTPVIECVVGAMFDSGGMATSITMHVASEEAIGASVGPSTWVTRSRQIGSGWSGAPVICPGRELPIGFISSRDRLGGDITIRSYAHLLSRLLRDKEVFDWG